MNSSYRKAFRGAFWALVVLVAVAAVLLTLAVVYGLPWLWALVKPWLQRVVG